MVTLSEALADFISSSPFLEEGLAEEIINLSALARKIRPRLEVILKKSLTESAISMALKRLTPVLKSRAKSQRKEILRLGDLTVRSGLKEFTYQNSVTILENQRKLLQKISHLTNPLVIFSQGMLETTTIINATLSDQIREVFNDESLVSELGDLASITIKLNEETVNTPGIYYSILKQLAWNDINVVEVVSTFTEFTIVLERSRVDSAFSILMNFLS